MNENPCLLLFLSTLKSLKKLKLQISGDKKIQSATLKNDHFWLSWGKDTNLFETFTYESLNFFMRQFTTKLEFELFPDRTLGKEMYCEKFVERSFRNLWAADLNFQTKAQIKLIKFGNLSYFARIVNYIEPLETFYKTLMTEAAEPKKYHAMNWSNLFRHMSFSNVPRIESSSLLG